MSEQPLALLLADDMCLSYHSRTQKNEIATELRRLHAENALLKEERDFAKAVGQLLKAERDAAATVLRTIASYEAGARESVQKGDHNTTLAIDLSGRAGAFLAAIDAARGEV